MNNKPPNPYPNQQNQNENPPQEEKEISQPPPIERPPPGTQDNIMNEIERGKNELEAIIGRLKACGNTSPIRV